MLTASQIARSLNRKYFWPPSVAAQIVGLILLEAAGMHSTPAEACPTYHTLTNGSTADATQVMDNFNYILECPDFSGNVGIATNTPYARFTTKLTSSAAASFTSISDYGANASVIEDASGSNLGGGILALGANFAGSNGIPTGIGFNRYGSNWGTDIRFYAHPDSTSNLNNWNEVMRIQGSGNVGIGTTSPSQALEVNGQVKIDTFASASATAVCQNANVLASCSSSIRYKENVKDAKFGLREVMALRPVTFKWKKRDENDMGFIAEEVEKINSLFVTYKAGKIEGVKYPQLTAVLVNAVKTLKATNDNQTIAIQNLQNENELLKKNLSALAKRFDRRLSSLESGANDDAAIKTTGSQKAAHVEHAHEFTEHP